jgi:hypothetical protein
MSREDDQGFARAVREHYQRSAAGDDAARQQLLERLRGARPPRRGFDWRRWVPGGVAGPQLRAALIAAGVLVLVGGALISRAVGPVGEIASRGPSAPSTGSDRAVVRFELSAPGAEGVTLVGDFNDWDPVATPMRRGASHDTWSVSLPVTRGRHVYGFLVDGHRWLPDPAAPLAPEDGFGSASSVVVVTRAES